MRRCVATCHAPDALECILLLAIVHLCDRVFLMTGWVCQRKRFWIAVVDTFQKAYREEWQRVDDGSICDLRECSMRAVLCAADSMRQRRADNIEFTIIYEQLSDAPSAPKSTWRAVGEPDALAWKLSGTEDTSAFREKRRHHCSSQNVYAI